MNVIKHTSNSSAANVAVGSVSSHNSVNDAKHVSAMPAAAIDIQKHDQLFSSFSKENSNPIQSSMYNMNTLLTTPKSKTQHSTRTKTLSTPLASPARKQSTISSHGSTNTPVNSTPRKSITSNSNNNTSRSVLNDTTNTTVNVINQSLVTPKASKVKVVASRFMQTASAKKPEITNSSTKKKLDTSALLGSARKMAGNGTSVSMITKGSSNNSSVLSHSLVTPTRGRNSTSFTSSSATKSHKKESKTNEHNGFASFSTVKPRTTVVTPKRISVSHNNITKTISQSNNNINDTTNDLSNTSQILACLPPMNDSIVDTSMLASKQLLLLIFVSFHTSVFASYSTVQHHVSLFFCYSFNACCLTSVIYACGCSS